MKLRLMMKLKIDDEIKVDDKTKVGMKLKLLKWFIKLGLIVIIVMTV